MPAKLISLAVLASISISTVSAVQITFKRFSRDGCHEETDHIAADTHLHDPYCKSFDTDEPSFYSFIVEPEDDMEDVYQKYCYAVIYDGVDCEGQAFTFGNMTEYINKCANSPIPGRSVRISCDAEPSTTVTGVMPTTVTRHALDVIHRPLSEKVVEEPVRKHPITTLTEHTYVVGPKKPIPTTTITLVEPPRFADTNEYWEAVKDCKEGHCDH